MKNKENIVLIISIIAIVSSLCTFLLNSQKETTTKEMTSEEKYAKYLSNLKNNLQEKLTTNDIKLAITSDSVVFEKGYKLSIDQNLDLRMTIYDNKEYNDYRVDTNVLNMFLIETGNGGYKSLYYLTEDGKLKFFCIDCLVSESNISIKEVNYPNIVNVTEGMFGGSTSSSWDALFIDIDGNILT